MFMPEHWYSYFQCSPCCFNNSLPLLAICPFSATTSSPLPSTARNVMKAANSSIRTPKREAIMSVPQLRGTSGVRRGPPPTGPGLTMKLFQISGWFVAYSSTLASAKPCTTCQTLPSRHMHDFLPTLSFLASSPHHSLCP